MNEVGSSKPSADPTDVFGSIDDLDCRGRRVFLRADPFLCDSLGVAPLTAPSPLPGESGAGGPEASPPRAPVVLSSLRRLLELEARVIVGTHLSAEASAETGLDSIESLASRLSERLQVEVLMPDECAGDAAARVLKELRQGQLCVLPDLLTTSGGGERRNDEAFARALGVAADAYVFDAFAASHLEYASLVRLPKLLPRRALGYRARHELTVLSRVFALNRGSVALAIGGQTFSDKIDVLTAWLPRVDKVCVGGGVAMTLLAAAGRATSDAGAELDRLAQARSLLGRAKDLGVELILPVDLRVLGKGEAETRLVSPLRVPDGARLIDVGPETMSRFGEVLGNARHLLWWGPLGNLRHAQGSAASESLARLCASPQIMSVVLGGDTRRFVRQLPPEIESGIELVSTGSAAAKALLGGRRLPGIEALRTRH